MRCMQDVELTGKWVLIREDFNVPLKGQEITNTARIDSALPTILWAKERGAKVILLSHLGRPTEGRWEARYSLRPVAEYLSACLGQPVPLFRLEDERPALQNGEVALLENVRFLEGEQKNANALAKRFAALGEIFVMDAFAVAHREQASTTGVAAFAPLACAGPLLQKELNAVQSVLKQAAHPVVAIVGGSKVSTKFGLLKHLLEKSEVLILGGGIANTFLAAQGCAMGCSLYESDWVDEAKALWDQAQRQGKTIWLPKDVIVAETMTAHTTQVKLCTEVAEKEAIFDVGPLSQQSLKPLINTAKTILWNGPLGVFEQASFSAGTRFLAQLIAKSTAYSVAGGGDTVAAVMHFQVQDQLSYLSTGGGAFLEALEGKRLPGVMALEPKRNVRYAEKD